LELASALGELQRLAHAIDLPDAVLVVSPIVVVTQTVLVLG
jgi:hypothetical protein